MAFSVQQDSNGWAVYDESGLRVSLFVPCDEADNDAARLPTRAIQATRPVLARGRSSSRTSAPTAGASSVNPGMGIRFPPFSLPPNKPNSGPNR